MYDVLLPVKRRELTPCHTLILFVGATFRLIAGKLAQIFAYHQVSVDIHVAQVNGLQLFIQNLAATSSDDLHLHRFLLESNFKQVKSF